MRSHGVRSLILILTLVLVGCAVGQREGEAPGLNRPNPATSPSGVLTEVETGRYFVEKARKHFRENELNEAEEVINRGFNVAPGNPALWHLLAKIRYLQEKYEESETFASRSLDYASGNSALVEQNWRLIAHARQASGDEAGARRALERIKEPTDTENWFFGFL